MIVSLCLLTMMAAAPHSVSAYFQQSEKTARDAATGRAGAAVDSARSAQRQVRDSLKATRGDAGRGEREAREGRQSDPAEREARQEGQELRDNDRGLRGRDRTPDELKAQLANAKEQEMLRHEGRMAQIEEVRAHAEQSANENALERIAKLVEKENALHEKKMDKLLRMEDKLAGRMSGERPSRENKNRAGKGGNEGGAGAEGKAGETEKGEEAEAAAGAESKAGESE